MKIQITKPLWRGVAVVGVSLLLVTSFQNCGKAGFDANLDSELAGSTTDASLSSQFGQSDATKVAAVPFAYNVLADVISYNSCTGSTLQSNPAFYTLKIGSHYNGGVQLRQSFYDYINTNFKPIYPNTTLSASQIKNYLAYSPANKAAAPQLAIRTRGKPQALRTASGTANVGLDFINLLSDLTNDRFMDPIIKSGTASVSYFPMAIEPTERSIVGQFSYNNSEAVAQSLRNDFRNAAQIALTYTVDGADAYAARAPSSTDTSKAYGRGYNLTFSVDVAPYTKVVSGNSYALPKSNNPNNILTAVQEVNLENPSSSSGATWSCDANRRYLVVRQQDQILLCPKESSSLLQDANYRAELALVRKHLRPEDWDVNVTLRCAVPKTGLCYPNETLNGSVVGIQYDQSQECFQGSDTQSFDNPSAPPTKRCAHYVSFCTRN